LAAEVEAADLEVGRIYPRLARIGEVSSRIAAAVAETAWSEGTARRPRPSDLIADIAASRFDPAYPSFVAGVDLAER
jgi:malate dehydrogenase (oxaloacetate-decarboxylating)(NADP+)